MNTSQIDLTKRYFDMGFRMLEDVICKCPDELWEEKKGGFVFWQQVLHTLTGISYWMRNNNERFVQPFPERNLHPEMEKEPENHLRRDELTEYKEQVKATAERFFEGKDDVWLHKSSPVYDKIKNIEIAYMQIRHIQYHVGHCDAILRENGYDSAEWLDYYGE